MNSSKNFALIVSIEEAENIFDAEAFVFEKELGGKVLAEFELDDGLKVLTVFEPPLGIHFAKLKPKGCPESLFL